MAKGDMSCDYCKNPIDTLKGYIEINITEWLDANSGDSKKIVVHRGCNSGVIEELMKLE